MSVLNQPFQGQLGDIILDKLKSEYKTFTIFSAFAKNSGVLRLKSSLEQFKENGGSINAFIGVDLDGTSYEALLNLFSVCDNLYVIHSENPVTTYHSKIYLLENDSSAWCAVGSNNLTGGGLWTNFESCAILEYDSISEQNSLNDIYTIIDKYTDPNYCCSSRITCIDDINTLLDTNYISKEVDQKITSTKKQRAQSSKQKKNHLFGSEKVSIPNIPAISKPRTSFTRNTDPVVDLVIDPPSVPAFTNEQFWFEMRKSTGGSRNILDLSMLGKIEFGSVVGTTYEYSHDKTHMLGGVKFFDVEPSETTLEKNITINYQGIDYYPSTIKFAPNNGSWRMQLKGAPSTGTMELSKYGNKGEFVFKILIFEKITPDYYVLSLLDEEELENIKSISKVWARNGNSISSKAYGML